MESTEEGTVVDGRSAYRKRRRTLISCTECHRRKQKCDRHQPCQNCVKRCKPDLCRYEGHDSKTCNNAATNAVTASSGESGIESSIPCSYPESPSTTNQLPPQDHRHLVSTLGYSIHNVHNTFGLVNKVGTTYPHISGHDTSADGLNRKQTALDEKYRSLVRQLPSKEYIDILVQQFFSEINWQYDVLDEITFRGQLENWRRFPYSVHTQAIGSLPVDVLATPSLVFQLMAHALIHQPESEWASSNLESLKYASGMTFVDLAHDFSEAGYSMIEAIEKKDISVVAVQSGILRASFLKNTGSVIEAWHVIGTTIMDAQEIGLHTNVAAPNSLVSIDALWNHEMRRRVWFVLHNWDIHMAVVLGRPITMIPSAGIVDLPDDLAQREIEKPPRRRTDQDPPTPSSVIRVGYDIAYQYFPRIRELENRGARAEDYNIVRETHAIIVGNMDRIPPWCHRDNPGTQFDEFPGCHWLPAARQSLASGIHFVLLSLHRPYIFSFPESRTEALKAAFIILTTQKRLFYLSEPRQYLSFNLVYPLFDAMVISLAVLVLFPNENRDVRTGVVENVYWGVDILAKIGQHNVMARSANSVVRSLLSRLDEAHEYALQHSSCNGEDGAIESLGSGMADLRALETSSHTGVTPDIFRASNVAGSLPLYSHRARPTASTSPELDVAAFLPPRPVGDLFYQDLYAPVTETIQGADFPASQPQIDGHYSDDSFWRFINDLSHA